MTDKMPHQTPELLMQFEGWLPHDQLLDPNHLGPLALLQGTWHGRFGLNTITLPSKEPANAGPERDLVNHYEETMVFEVLPGLTPNRGATEDQFVSQLKYHTDVVELGTGNGLHFENGLFLNRGVLDTGEETVCRLARQCSVPHGNSVICRGVVAEQFEGPPTYPQYSTVTVRPFVADLGGLDQRHLEQALSNALAAEGLTVEGGVHLHFDTDWAQEPEMSAANSDFTSAERAEVHGIGSIPFVSDQATTTGMQADFYILRCTNSDGERVLRLQYLQRVILKFFGPDWAHVDLNHLQLVDTEGPAIADDAPTFTEWAVENAFEALLSRSPKDSELRNWTRRIDEAAGRNWADLVTALMKRARYRSLERRVSVEDRVERYYQFMLGRSSDAGGKTLTVNEINAGRGVKRITDMLISAEAREFYESLHAES